MVVEDVARVAGRARTLLHAHALTAADALQLAAALVWVRDHSHRYAFVCADESLAAAADREGFRVIIPR